MQSPTPIISGTPVNQVKTNFKFLGTIISQNLQFKVNRIKNARQWTIFL